MTQEDKELVFKDLSARLPYHVRVKVWLKEGTTEEGILDLEYNYGDVLRDAFYYNKIVDIKPYLRPMSSMTEEEQIVYRNLHHTEKWKHVNNVFEFDVVYSRDVPLYIDWLNAHHFDYRGLIEKGLALEAPTGMYNLEKK